MNYVYKTKLLGAIKIALGDSIVQVVGHIWMRIDWT
jgi:hypothetical protein